MNAYLIDQAYYSALHNCYCRYDDMIRERAAWDGWFMWEEVHIFIELFHKGIESQMPLNKLNRWLGYIQGVLIERGVTTVEVERNFTRPLFKHLDFPEE